MNSSLLSTLLIAHLSFSELTSIPKLENKFPESNQDICNQIVIGHRGASGYTPEHTLGSYALAITMGADYVEPDLVMTKDGYLVARHENEISQTTDVAQHPEFESRHRTQTIDGQELTGWFTEDFTLCELKTLRAVERIPEIRPGNARMDGAFEIPTFQEIIDLVKSMQRSQSRVIGIYPEIKHSTHFQSVGLPMEGPVVLTFFMNGYWSSRDPVYIQSFEVSNLKQLSRFTSLKLLQLFDEKSIQPYDQVVLGTNLTYGDMATAEGLKEVAKYASAVGPDKIYIIPRDENNRLGAVSSFVEDAHAVDLKVHPYTFRAENAFLPAEFQSDDASPTAIGSLDKELKAYFDAGIDGVFSDQPDKAVRARGKCIK